MEKQFTEVPYEKYSNPYIFLGEILYKDLYGGNFRVLDDLDPEQLAVLLSMAERARDDAFESGVSPEESLQWTGIFNAIRQTIL